MIEQNIQLFKKVTGDPDQDPNDFDLNAVPFDAFYLFLEKNDDSEKGKCVGELLLKKFGEAFLDQPQEEFLPAFGAHWNLTNAKHQADRVFSQFRENQLIYQQRVEAASLLTHATYAYHNSLLLRPDVQQKSESLANLKDILQPFFTDELKQPDQTLPVRKGIWRRLFS